MPPTILSIDMFQTLADLERRKYPFYRAILGEKFTRELADRCWRIGIGALGVQFSAIQSGKIDYVPLRDIFAYCFRQISKEIAMDFDTDRAAKLFASQHAESPLFEDAMEFLEKAGAAFPICLASDTDAQMLGDLKRIYPFDHIFTSERLRAYKLDSRHRFFMAIVRHYQAPPAAILHIGDAPPDIVGATAAGLSTCWVNRNGGVWRLTPKPDHEVTSLLDVLDILEERKATGFETKNKNRKQ